MDWELYDRYRASAVLGVLVLFSVILLTFQNSPFVRKLKSIVVYGSLPIHRLFIHDQENVITAQQQTGIAPTMQETERLRTLSVLAEENDHLHELLELRKHRWPTSVAAHVVARRPQRWFKDLMIDKGVNDGISVDYAVVTHSVNHDVLVGRVIEVLPQTSRVMLVQDPLSAVPATLGEDIHEDGVIEGTGGQEMLLRYLGRDTKAKIGDLVVTSGLGGIFPPGLAIGTVQSLSPDDRQLFLEAKLNPVTASGDLRVVLVLIPSEEPK